jgi:hypothetical protein
MMIRVLAAPDSLCYVFLMPKWRVNKTYHINADDNERSLLKGLRQQGVIKGSGYGLRRMHDQAYRVYELKTGKWACDLKLEMNQGPTDVAIESLGYVAYYAGMYEIRLRLLCGRIPGQEETSLDHRLSVVEDTVINPFKGLGQISDEDAKAMLHARQLRNKVLHCDFKVAAAKIEAAKPGSLSLGQVHTMTLATGKVTRVVDAEGPDVHGWLLEAQSGLLAAALEAIEKAIAIAVRLVNWMAVKGM